MKRLQLMVFCGSLAFAASIASAASQASNPAAALWNDLREKRESLSRLHQEFEVKTEHKTQTGTQASKRSLTVDISHERWSEKSVSGSGNHLRIFDGSDSFHMEEGGEEFVRTPHRAKQEMPAPAPYTIVEADWSKAREIERRPCEVTGKGNQCVLLEVPLKPHNMAVSGAAPTRRAQGVARVLMDLTTGMLLQATSSELIEQGSRSWQTTVTYAVKKAAYGGPVDPDFAKLPPGLKEVKELPQWNAAKLNRALADKPAPELTVREIGGKQISLADFRGKTVLLDFWTTWCPPCRADAPALDKLYRKYGGRELEIIGVSVSEEHAVVEKFLSEHPHSYPIVLTTENEFPRPYQVGEFPTYIVIGKDGTVSAATEGDKGFGELRRLLKKAGLEAD